MNLLYQRISSWPESIHFHFSHYRNYSLYVSAIKMESCSHAENKSCIWAIKCFHGRGVLAKILTYSKTPASFPPLRPHTQLVNWSQFYFHSCPLSLRFPQCSLTLISPICTCFHLFPFPPIPYWPLTLLLSSPVSLRIPKGFGLLASIVCSRGGGRLRASLESFVVCVPCHTEMHRHRRRAQFTF